MKNFILILTLLITSTALMAKTRQTDLIKAHVVDQICEEVCVLYVEENKTGKLFGLVVDQDYFADIAELHAAIDSQVEITLRLETLKAIDKETSALIPQDSNGVHFLSYKGTLSDLLKL